MVTNATLHIVFPSVSLSFPVTWSDVDIFPNGFPEGEVVADRIFFNPSNPAVDGAWDKGEHPEMFVIFDADPTLRCSCAFESEAQTIYPLRTLAQARAKTIP